MRFQLIGADPNLNLFLVCWFCIKCYCGGCILGKAFFANSTDEGGPTRLLAVVISCSLKTWKISNAAPSYHPLVLHANLKLHRNRMILGLN